MPLIPTQRTQLPPESEARPASASLLRQLLDSVFAVVFPTVCSICGRELVAAGWLNTCERCWQHLDPWGGPVCGKCGIPFPSELAEHTGAEPAAGLCGRCRTGAYQFDLARSYGLYRGNLRRAILQFKFKRRERLGVRLGTLLFSAWRSAQIILGETSPDKEAPLLVPVPLHSSRQRERGFNQAELLARGLALASRPIPVGAGKGQVQAGDCPAGRVAEFPPLRVEARCLRRVRATKSQSGLSLSARRDNVRGVFHTARSERVRGRTVILVDDVMTTGATASACAAALKQAGAGCVIVLTLAHASPQFPDMFRSPTDKTGDWAG
jgi:predicted amidophosphoribosyltransferase